MDMRGQAAHGADRGEGSPPTRESRQSFRRLRWLLALSLVLPAMVAVGMESARATHVESFEIDGDTEVNQGGIDWDTPVGTRVTDPSGSDDASNYTGGSKEFEHPDKWVQGTGTAAPKTDITDVYTYTATDHDGHVQAYFGFRRIQDQGTVNYDVELNQEPNYSNDPARPTRTPGDLLVRFEQNGNNPLPFQLTLAYKWTLQSNFYKGCIEVVGYDPRAGWCPISTAAAGFVGDTGEGGAFAEGTFDLTDLFGADTCRPAFGTMNIRSIPGESLGSELKDYVAAPIGIPPACWKPVGITNVPRATYDVAYDWSVDKNVSSNSQTVAAGANATFTYRVLVTAGDEQRHGNDLGGTVTLTNPNDSPMVATLGVTATSGTGCTFPGVPDVSPDTGLQVAVPNGNSGFVYTCAASSPPDNGTSTATVRWDATAFRSGTEGSSYTASSVAAYTFALDQSTDEQTTVTDTFHAGAAQVLGTFTWAAVYNETDASTPPHTVVVATYTRTITAGAPGTCAAYVNTAKQTENDTGQSTTSPETVTVCAAPLPPAPVEVAPVEVAPEQASGKAVGSVRATCQGTVRSRLNNRSGDTVTYKLRVGTKVHKIVVKSLSKKRFTTSGKARARVTLKIGSRTLDKVRIPGRCASPEVLPDTGLRATAN